MVYEDTQAQLKLYNARILRAEQYMETLKPAREKAFMRYRNSLLPTQVSPNGHRVAVPLGTAIIDGLYAAMTSMDVEFTVQQRAKGSRVQARVVEQALNNVLDEAKMNRKVHRAIKEAMLARIGYVKVGYEYAEQEVTKLRSDEAIQGDMNAIFDGAEQNGLVPPTPADIASIVPTEETVKEAVRDRIVLDYVPYDEVLYDPTYRNWDSVRWVAQVMYLAPEEVYNNPTFVEYCRKNRCLKKLNELKPDKVVRPVIDSSSGTVRVDNALSGVSPDDTVDARFSVFEFYNLVTGRACTFAKGADFFLNETMNPFSVHDDLEDRNPFVAVILRDDPEHVEGISEMDVAEAALEELDVYRSMRATHLARSVGKILMEEGVLTDAGKTGLESTEWNAVVEMASGHTTQDVKSLEPPTLAPEAYNLDERIANDAKDSVGMNELMQGLFPQRRQTATATQAVVMQSTARQAEKQTVLQNVFTDIGWRVLALMQMYYDKPRIVRLTDEEGDFTWEYTAEDITMQADLRVALTPKEQITHESRRDTAITVLNLVMPTIGIPNNPIDINRILKWALEQIGIEPQDISEVLNLPAEQQQAAVGQIAQDAAATQANAEAQAAGAAQGQGAQVPDALAAALASGVGQRPATPADVENLHQTANVTPVP